MSKSNVKSKVSSKSKTEIKYPDRYNVVFVNDDYTPMDFVVQVLQEIFHLDRERATSVMLQVHNEGSGVCGVFTRDIAETKVMQVHESARAHHHPLKCVMEENK